MVLRTGVIFLLSLVYAIVRYNVFGGVAAQNIPSYVVNKALGAASAICLLIGAVDYFRRQTGFPKWCLASFAFAVPHVLLSLALWSREYYPKLYRVDKMNASGEMTLLFGVLNFCVFLAIIGSKSARPRSLQWSTAALLALHTAALGWQNWLAVSPWPGGMPPISLITCLIALLTWVFFLGRRGNFEAG